MSFAVEVSGLTKQFVRRQGRKRERLVALDGVSFTIARGECVAVLGQNGSGKSTLVRVLSTLLLHDGGTARVFGHDVIRDDDAVRRVVNRVSVEASFFKRMSASENLSYAARFYGLPPSHTRRRIPEILERVGFPTDRASAPMEDLSRGMQQKVALARALLTSPTLLLLDEPTTGLDPRAKLEVQAFIREVRREHDTTTLLCTHDMAEAETLADRVGILDGGRLLALEESPALLLLDEPTTGLDPRSKREVQDFIRAVRVTHDTTTLLCTHDMAEAEALADRVGILDGGRLLALDTAAALMHRYEAATLEDAFLSATGRVFEDEEEEVA